SQALDRLLRPRANFIVARPLVHNRGVVVRDIGDVGRLIDDGHVARGRNDRVFEPRRAKLFCFDEAILVRTDVVITVRPIVDAGSAIEARFRRQWGPTDVVITFRHGVFFFRERLFARVEFVFALRELLFLLRLMLGVEPLLYLTIDLSLTFRVSLLLLARRKDRQRDDEQQSKNLFHGKALDYKFAVIFEQRQSDFFALNRAFSRCVVAIVQDEILTHIVFSFSL